MNSHHDPQDAENRPADDTPDGTDQSAESYPSDRRDTSDGAGPAAAPPNSGPEPPAAHRFFVWLRSLGIRRGQDRWIGGVASGIAARIGIDPVIVRGLFILFVIFGGVGVLLYGLAWALLPEPDGRIHLEGATRGYWSDGMTGALTVTIFGLVRPFGSWWDGAWDFGDALWTLIWVGGLIALCVWLINSARDRKQKRTTAGHGPDAGTGVAGYPSETAGGTPRAADASQPAGAPQSGYEIHRPADAQAWPAAPAATDASASASPPTYGTDQSSDHRLRHGNARPPAYAQSNQHVPAPAPTAYATQTKSSRRTPSAAMVAISTGLALLVGGGLLALHYTGLLDLGTHAGAVAAAAAAVVLGLSIVVAGLRGRTSGTMGFLAVVALIAAAISGLVPTSSNFVVASNATWQPDTIDAAETGYTTLMADGTLELEGIEDQAPLDEEVVIPVNVAMGSSTVIVPEDIPVEVRSNLLMGSVDFESGGAGSDGIWNPTQQTFNADAPGEKIIIEVRGFFSSATIAESGNGFSQ
ncbi:PspC domain-containing protein [Arthrobacter pigmenti]